MTTFYEQVNITPKPDDLPLLELKQTDFSKYLFDLDDLDRDQQLLWDLANALFENRPLDWLRDLVKPGLEDTLGQFRKQYTNDSFSTVFVYLTYGQRERASDEARRAGDFKLSMYISHSATKDLRAMMKEQIEIFQKTPGEWSEYSEFRKKCWYVIAGEFGLVETNLVVTEGISWQCIIGMHLWYSPSASLVEYNETRRVPVNPNLSQMATLKRTAAPDKQCLWYQLLQWWLGDPGMAHLDSWPLDLLFLLSVYLPDRIQNDVFIEQWRDELEKMDKVEWALFVSQFGKKDKAADRVKYILRNGEWEDQDRLVQQFQIPKKWIYIAKSLRAHDDWDFEAEYECLIEGELLNEAFMALLHFLLPKNFYCTPTALRTGLTYIMEYPDQDRPDIQLLKEAYMYLINKQEEKKDDLLQRLQEYSSLLENFPNAHQLIIKLINAIQD
ncbi:hypothetical protein RMATCC62417_01831 [Rhizopus microsporus]|nr:hypothetical protein RMATCC62417_01831 [Rhizopus microsporus]